MGLLKDEVLGHLLWDSQLLINYSFMFLFFCHGVSGRCILNVTIIYFSTNHTFLQRLVLLLAVEVFPFGDKLFLLGSHLTKSAFVIMGVYWFGRQASQNGHTAKSSLSLSLSLFLPYYFWVIEFFQPLSNIS